MQEIWGRVQSLVKHRRRIVAGSITALLTGLLGLLAAIPMLSPSTGAQLADTIRSVAGPRPVAFLEGVSLAMQDTFNRFVASYDGGRKTISLTQANISQNLPKIQRKSTDAVTKSGTVKLAIMLPPYNDVASAPPQIGWRALQPFVNGSPVMAEALLTLDPQRSYSGIALVRIDLGLLKLHMMPGFLEPSHVPNVVSSFPNLGMIPVGDQRDLVAAFNGGFKAINGHYGMMVNGLTLLPPRDGVATLAIYKDGHVAIGTWGQDILASPEIVAFRQNCPLVVQAGRVNPQVYIDDRTLWGETIGNRDISWRTGLGLSQDGRYLIYAVGNGTSVETLARALQEAGAYNAMQLDINRPFAHFVTYRSSDSSAVLKALPLLNQMEDDPTLYLAPHSRDFFYLTIK